MSKTIAKANPVKSAKQKMTLTEVMSALKRAGSEQTKKTYTRHGAKEPLFGVSFATLKVLWKRIGVDHELALALWNTGNFDARNLAFKIADPAQMSPADLDHWAGTPAVPMCSSYVAYLTAEGPHAATKAEKWRSSSNEDQKDASWGLVSAMAMIDETTADAWFETRLAEIEKNIHAAPNKRRGVMNQAVISIGCRNAALRKKATAVAKRIGKVDIDHGDTACKTPDAAEYIEKCWARSKASGYESPAAQERDRESMRTRC